MTLLERLSTIRLFIRKNWFILFLITIAFLMIVSFIFRLLTPPLPPTSENNQWQGIAPGITTLDQIQSKLGNPVAVQQTPLGKQVQFTSTYPMIPHQVFVDDQQKVQLVKEAVPTDAQENINTYQGKFGPSDLQLYGEDIGDTNILYLYSRQGFAISAREADGGVEEKWYFVPTTPAEFMTKWGNDLHETTQSVPEFAP